jgi:hypothetical protein
MKASTCNRNPPKYGTKTEKAHTSHLRIMTGVPPCRARALPEMWCTETCIGCLLCIIWLLWLSGEVDRMQLAHAGTPQGIMP